MIHLDLPQGSEAWIRARLGIPTASQFHRLITPKSGRPSAAQEGYLNELLAEHLLGEPVDPDLSLLMQRGTDLEERAVRYYEAMRDVDTQPAGFCLTDDRRCGASPDRLAGDAGGVEIKCPGPAVHIGYLRTLREPKPTQYYAQIQGALLVTGFQWWDFLSFHPLLPPALVRYERDEPFIAILGDVLDGFCRKLDEEKAYFRDVEAAA